MTDNFILGDHNVICDRCGHKVKASATRKEWNGLRVCTAHWEARHPQEFVRGRPERARPVDPRPVSTDLFLTPNQVTASNLNIVGTPDTTVAGNTTWDNGGTIWDNGATLWD
jgi:hypothetical protein